MLKLFIYISISLLGVPLCGFAQTETFDATLKRHEQEIDILKAAADPQHGSVHHYFWVGPAKNSVAYLGTIQKSGGGLLEIGDSAGATKVQVDSETDGGLVNVFGKSGKSVSSLEASQDGGMVIVRDNSGNKAAVLFADGQGKGALYLLGKTGMDMAEEFNTVEERLRPGTVVSIASDGRVAPSSRAYDPAAVGVVSGAGSLSPAISLGEKEPFERSSPVAIAGQVYVRVCLEAGTISPGDLIVPSSRPGLAMRASNRKKSFGSVIGKALEGFDSRSLAQNGEGLIRILVMVK
jgi:hypothetical protein